MSAKVKFSGASSTPVKTSTSEVLSVPASPVRGNKYKNFLVSVLTPSKTRKWLKKKKANKSDDLARSKPEIEEVYKGSQTSDESSDNMYSSVQDLQLQPSLCQATVVDSVSPSIKLSEKDCHQLVAHTEASCLKSSGEPLYAVVNKQRKLKGSSVAIDTVDSSHKLKPNKKNLSEHKVSGPVNKNTDALSSNLIDEQKEEIKLLMERMKELSSENRDLHKNIEKIIREEKWKEDSLHADLKLKISQLEADTHKEVKCLTDQIKSLLSERKVLSDQIHILHEEKQLLQVKYEDACRKSREMVSRDFMKKMTEEHEKSLNQAKKRHSADLKKLKQENEITLESKILLIEEVEELKEKVNWLTSKLEMVQKSEQELLKERKQIVHQLEESKEMQQEAQNMLLSLLKITENISIERDVLINKASFQDHQQKLLQTSILDYSVNMGRLQEHFSNISREKSVEMQKLRSGESLKDENRRKFYERQLEMLRLKVLDQSNTINDLESEKKKLEQQLETVWQSTCTEKHRTDAAATYGISSYNS